MLRNVSCENEEKLGLLIDQLYNMGDDYVVLLDQQTSIKGLITVIEMCGLQCKFDFPEGDFNAFKKAVMNGDYDDIPDNIDADTDIHYYDIKDCISDSLDGKCQMFIDMPRDVWNKLAQEAYDESQK